MKRFTLCLLVLGSCVEISYADSPDPYQNSLINTTVYDLASKFYAGLNFGSTSFSNASVTLSNQSTSLDTNSVDYGVFGGYKFNQYFSLEGNFQRLGHITQNGGGSLPLTYSAKISNLSLDGLLGYPVFMSDPATVSLFGKAGYGFNFTNYNYSANNGTTSASNSTHEGAYNFGVGANVDFRYNLSMRADYTYYQVNYPLINGSSAHNANVFALGLYYNFS